METYEKYLNEKQLNLNTAPFDQIKKIKKGEKVVFKSKDGLNTVDTVFDVWNESGELYIELDKTEQTLVYDLRSGKKISF